MTPEVEQFLRDFKSAKFYCRKLIRLNMELEAKETELTWGRHNTASLTPEQAKSPLPMPTNTSRYLSQWDWDLWNEIEQIRHDIVCCQAEIKKCLIVEALEDDELRMLADRYWFNVNPYDCAEKYGYSKSGMYKSINSRLTKLLKLADTLKRVD